MKLGRNETCVDIENKGYRAGVIWGVAEINSNATALSPLRGQRVLLLQRGFENVSWTAEHVKRAKIRVDSGDTREETERTGPGCASGVSSNV